MSVELLVKGRFRPLAGATCRKVAANAWEVRVPKTPENLRLAGPELRGLDGAVFGVDGLQTEPGVVSAEGRESVTVSVWVL